MSCIPERRRLGASVGRRARAASPRVAESESTSCPSCIVPSSRTSDPGSIQTSGARTGMRSLPVARASSAGSRCRRRGRRAAPRSARVRCTSSGPVPGIGTGERREQRAARGPQARPRAGIACARSTWLPRSRLDARFGRASPRSVAARRWATATPPITSAPPSTQPARDGLAERQRADRHGQRRHEVQVRHRARGLESAQRDAPGHVAAERGAEPERRERDPVARVERAEAVDGARRSRTAGT